MNHFIVKFDKALTSEFCEHLVQKFEQSPQKTPGRTGAGVDVKKKDSLDLYISSLDDWKDECNAISNIIYRGMIQYARAHPFILTGAVSLSIQDPKSGNLRTITHEDVSKMSDDEIGSMVQTIYRLDNVNLQRYTKGKGGYHHWHSEHFPHPKDSAQKSLHRVLLWLIYLNDVSEGGETEFFFQQVKIEASQGGLVMAPCGFTHTHRGLVPVSNDKYVLASWVMYKEAPELYQNG